MTRTLFIVSLFAFVPFTSHAALSDGLVMCAPLDEASGTRVDETANGNDLTDSTGVGSVPSVVDNGADFESGDGDYLSITDAAQTGLDLTSDFTMSGFMTFESFPAGAFGAMDLASKWTSAGNQRSYILSYRNLSSTPNFVLLTSSNGSANELLSVPHTLGSTGTAYMLTVQWDASAAEVEFFVDTASVGTDSGSITSIFDSSSDFYLGQQGGGQFFDGVMDEFAVWDRLLDGSERSSLYNSGSGLACADLVPSAPASFRPQFF